MNTLCIMPPPRRQQAEKVQLNPDTDFTLAALRNYLNETYGAKESGNAFTIQDIQGYEAKRHIPDAYGGYDIQVLENTEIGIKLLRLKNFSRAKGKSLAKNVDAKSWSIHLRDLNPGSNWVQYKGCFILLSQEGRILAANTRERGKMEGQDAIDFVVKELGWQA